jgi:hypothetical protein
MDERVAEFWKEFERETGETVVDRCLGEYFPAADKGEGRWGLLVLTDKSFRFRETPSDGMILGLVRRSTLTKKAVDTIDLAIPIGEIVSVESPKRALLDRLFGASAEVFSVRRAGEGGEVYRFSADARAGLIAALRKASQPA